MFIDYLDPFWPVRAPEAPERSDEQQRDDDQPAQEDVRDVPERREDSGYDEHGETVDEYA